jgi:hypothetical protein
MGFITFLSIVTTAQKQADEYNKGEFFVGYSGATLFNGSDKFEKIENGFNVAGVYNFHRYIGIKGDVSGTYRNVKGTYFAPFGSPPIPPTEYTAQHSLYNATAGVQVKDNRIASKYRPFAHVLVGVGKHRDKLPSGCPSGAVCPPFGFDFTGVSLIIGGGLDVNVNRRIDIRVIQFDLNPITYRDGEQTSIYANNRFSSGIIFKF